MNEPEKRSVGQIVAADYRAAHVFRNFNVDFCCGGDKSVEEACATTDANPKEVITALENLPSDESVQDNYNNWSLDFLIDYIINNHHNKTRERLPEIEFYAKKVATVHGSAHEELIEMYHEFTKLSREMDSHMAEEEKQLFPFIKNLLKKNNGMTDEDKANSAEMIAMMEHEHDEAGDAMKKIKKLSSNYTLPDDACTSYRVYYKSLAAFEQDLHKHVHLENNILFPKALKLNSV